MRSLFSHILIITLATITIQGINAEGFYKWKDARGNIQYGDKPPENIRVEKFKMPEITVLEGFRNQWLPTTANTVTNNVPRKVAVKQDPEQKLQSYSKFIFIAPRNNQVIKPAFNGSVSAMLSIKPPLKKGHRIAFSLDGKEISKSTSRTNNFNNLRRGSHTISANVIGLSGEVVMTSAPVSFKVMRNASSNSRDELR